MSSEVQRSSVAAASRVLAAQGVADLIWGHVSARDEMDRGFWIKRAGIGLGEVTPDDVHLLGWDGSVREGPQGRHLEWPIHACILQARPDVGAVVHTHGRAVLALMATGSELRPISHEGSIFVPPRVPVFDKTTDLIETTELGELLASGLRDRNAAFMRCHGSVTVGSTIAVAVATAVLLERACSIQLAALSAGPLKTWSTDVEASAKRRHFDDPVLTVVYEHLRRLSTSPTGTEADGV